MRTTKHLQADSAARSDEAERRRSAELTRRKVKQKAAESGRLRQETMRAALTAQPARRQPALPVVDHAIGPHVLDVPEHQEVESLLRLGLQATALVEAHAEPISKALPASSSEAPPESAHEKPPVDASSLASSPLTQALDEIHALRAELLHAGATSCTSPPAGAAAPVTSTAAAEREEPLPADRLEARLTFIEAFYSDALSDPAEKQLLSEALAQIRQEAVRAEEKQQGGDSASDVLLASACEGIAAGIPLAVLAEQLAVQMAGANRTSAKQTPTEPARADERGTVGGETPGLERALPTLQRACQLLRVTDAQKTELERLLNGRHTEANAFAPQGKQALPGSDTLPLVTLQAM
jgi:hypothetical protein